ncbi:DNA excision repair protein ERCC-6-like isoform X2 [Corticium candelabrum]|uniref:DNA excision repair protein ERCC-6-like isoform X2 n=1 Tax=Corticium candelabrum TaxID=121492 RepID=UPI002E363ADB|nr:DNA excision repair protein ERCC-6-like isoform X2 [Corticium candelabrum]
MSSQEEASSSRLPGFSVDSSLIPTVESSEELRELGVCAFAQETFEKGFIEQVDKALAEQEAALREKRLRKDVRRILDQIRAVEVSLTQHSKLCQSLASQLVLTAEQKLQLVTARKQQSEKRNELTELRKQEKLLFKALQEGKEIDDVSEAKGVNGESLTLEQEQMIQCGEMTPFGTVLSSFTSETVQSNRQLEIPVAATTEKTVPGEEIVQEKSNISMFTSKTKKRNRTVDKGFHHVQHVQDVGKDGDGDGDYVPNMSEYCESFYSSASDDSESTCEPDAKRRHQFEGQSRLKDRYQPRDFSDDEDKYSSKRKLRRQTIRLSCQDDGNEELYKKRLRQYERKKERKLQRNQQQLEAAELDDVDIAYSSDSLESDGCVMLQCLQEEDMVFEGGLKVPGPIWSKLYKYQKTGVKWLWELHGQQCGGILGDDMGLGKTIQVIAFLAGLQYGRVNTRITRRIGLGSVLVVCPATVMHQWVREFHTWWPIFRVAVLHNTGSHVGSKKELVKRIALHPDEGHIIRNPDSEITLACKQFRTPHRLILSGSPIQNNLRELWSLFDFIFPGKLGTLPVFMEQFSVPITMGGYANASTVQVQTAYRCACVLRDTISPYLLRRLKADVQMSLHLPSKNEQVLFCQLTPEQIHQYKKFLSSEEVEMVMGQKHELQIFPALMTLRKICNHPDLASPEFYDLGGNAKGSSDASKTSSRTAVLQSQSESSDKDYGFWKRSGKLVVVNSLLRLWKRQDHRVLIFTQTRQMLNIIEKYVQLKCYKYLRMDGAISVGSRQPLVKKFNQDSSIFLFLLTTRVGGLGINLVGADRVIIFDPDWNPSTDIQAQERAWRIGQRRNVTIYRLLTSGTIEEKIYHRQIFKQYLTNKILKNPSQRRFFKQNDLYELFTLSTADETQGTETSAIFAGTGSDVIVSSVRPKQLDCKKQRIHNKSKDKVLEMIKRISQSLGKESNVEPLKESSKEQEHLSEKSKRKARKKAGSTLEGSYVDGLERSAEYRLNDKEGVKEQRAEFDQYKTQEDYILHKLFKKSGLHSALQHDTIMEASSVDHVLIESDANRVAQEAARALRQSRRQCLAAAAARGHVGTPTWTGNAGIVGGPKSTVRPRFGAKRKSFHVSNADSTAVERTVEQNANSAHCSIVAQSAPSSANLLEEMRSRNAPLADVLNPPRSEEDGGQSMQSLPTGEYDRLIDDIRMFVAFQCHVDGQATTQEILTNFAPRLKSRDSSVFRAMLRQICDFERDDTRSGVWRLKADYR